MIRLRGRKKEVDRIAAHIIGQPNISHLMLLANNYRFFNTIKDIFLTSLLINKK
jgi:hypothetical protein